MYPMHQCTNAFQSSFVPSSVSVYHLLLGVVTAPTVKSFAACTFVLVIITGYTPPLAYHLDVYPLHYAQTFIEKSLMQQS